MHDIDVGENLLITKTARRASGPGTWVCGSLNGYAFNALVFPEHAENKEFELGDSKISKLWLRRESDRQVVFNFDRGLDVSAQGDDVRAVLDFLCIGLADCVFSAAEDTRQKRI